MIGKYRMMNSTNPMSPGVVIPADFGRVFFIVKNEWESELRMITKAWPPKYICVLVHSQAMISTWRE